MPTERYLRKIPERRETLGQRIRRERLARGWSQEYLAEVVGMPQPRLSALERGTTSLPRGSTLRRLNDALGLPANTLGNVALAQRDDEDDTLASIPANSYAIPGEPDVLDTVRVVFKLSDDAMAAVRRLAEHVAQSEDVPDAPPVEDRILSFARYLAERRAES